MARGGVYKSDVEKARKQLLSKGKRPSVALIREALGDTGSYATIHKFLKEVEAEDPAGTSLSHPVSDTIAELISRLAGRLHEEAQEEFTAARARFDADLAERDTQLARRQSEAEQLSAGIQRLETALHDERNGHSGTRHDLAAAQTLIRQLEERIAGLTTRVAEHEAHSASLEAKHEQAREALDHFRTAAREQREQEHQRHEHQVQGLQAELRQAQDSVTAKNQELLQLNRDNARLSEHVGQQDKELTQLRAAVRDRDHELKSLRPLVAEHKALETRFAHSEAQLASLAGERAELEKALSRERDARLVLEGEKVRARTIEDVIARLHDPQRAPAESTVASKDPS